MASQMLGHFLLGILLISLFASVFTTDDGCPKIHVKKNQILRTKEALNKGAKYLKRTYTDTAKDCYKLCCKIQNCNLAMLSYKNSTTAADGKLKRMCYLFDCGKPISKKCSFSPYEHYATIEFEERVKEPSWLENYGGKHSNNEDKPASKSASGSSEECPPGAPEALCYKDPCADAFCPTHPLATCKTSTCGTCHAKFYGNNGKEVSCYDDEKADLETGPKTKVISDAFDNWNEPKTQPKKPQYKPQQKKPLYKKPHASSNSHSEESFEDRLEQAMREKSQKEHNQWKNPKPATAKPFHQWREFIDNNPKYGKAHKVTEKLWPQDKKKPKVHPKPTRPAQPKTHPKPTHQNKPHMLPVTKPTKGAQVVPHEPPKPDADTRSRNISDVVVIETSNLHIVENKAVLPLTIFLVIAILMLFVVALRLRIVKSRLRRKAFATDDADYLINGMYL